MTTPVPLQTASAPPVTHREPEVNFDLQAAINARGRDVDEVISEIKAEKREVDRLLNGGQK